MLEILMSILEFIKSLCCWCRYRKETHIHHTTYRRDSIDSTVVRKVSSDELDKKLIIEVGKPENLTSSPTL